MNKRASIVLFYFAIVLTFVMGMYCGFYFDEINSKIESLELMFGPTPPC